MRRESGLNWWWSDAMKLAHAIPTAEADEWSWRRLDRAEKWLSDNGKAMEWEDILVSGVPIYAQFPAGVFDEKVFLIESDQLGNEQARRLIDFASHRIVRLDSFSVRDLVTAGNTVVSGFNIGERRYELRNGVHVNLDAIRVCVADLRKLLVASEVSNALSVKDDPKAYRAILLKLSKAGMSSTEIGIHETEAGRKISAGRVRQLLVQAKKDVIDDAKARTSIAGQLGIPVTVKLRAPKKPKSKAT